MKICIVCGKDFEPKNEKGKFCSKACKQKDYRKSINAILNKVKTNNVTDYSKQIPESNYSIDTRRSQPQQSNETVKENVSTQKEADVLRSAENGNKGILWNINNSPKVIYDPSKGLESVKHTLDIEKQIEAIRSEICPKERSTTLGRKIWQREQENKIFKLKSNLI